MEAQLVWSTLGWGRLGWAGVGWAGLDSKGFIQKSVVIFQVSYKALLIWAGVPGMFVK